MTPSRARASSIDSSERCAKNGEVFVTRTLVDLVAGSGIQRSPFVTFVCFVVQLVGPVP